MVITREYAIIFFPFVPGIIIFIKICHVVVVVFVVKIRSLEGGIMIILLCSYIQLRLQRFHGFRSIVVSDLK